MLRFIGIASVVPRSARKNTQSATTGHASCVPFGFSSVTVRRSIAGIAEMTMLPVAYPADDAVDTAHVVSRIESGLFARFAFVNDVQIAYERMHAVRFT